MSREDPQTKIRFAADLKLRLIEAAKANGRTINAEVVNRIESSFVEANADLSKGVAARQISEIHAMVLELQAAIKTPQPNKSPFLKKSKSPH